MGETTPGSALPAAADGHGGPAGDPPGSGARRGAGEWMAFLLLWPVRHWRGEISLGYAFWLNGLLGNILVFAVVRMAKAAVEGPDPAPWLLVFSAAWAFKLIVVAWQCVGAWRSADRHVDRGGTRFWAIVAKVAVGFIILVTVFVAFFAVPFKTWPS